MRSAIKNLLHRFRVGWALRRADEPVEELPNPELPPLDAAARQRVRELKSVCLFLGPYRNLTTLTASILFLHPNCQVLNHAGPRVFEEQDRNFLDDYSDHKFETFSHFAIHMSQGGARGKYGGSIALSHAFANHEAMRNAYADRYGTALGKKQIDSLVWKESERTSQHIRENNVDLGKLFQKNQQLRFLMPIRNPIDCAFSIVKIGMDGLYAHLETFDVQSVLGAVLEEIHWFMELQQEYPQRFFCFYQDAFNEQVLRDMAQFLGLQPDERWVADSLSVYRLGKPYEYSPDLLAFFKEKVEEVFADFPEAGAQLQQMVDTAAMEQA